MTGKGTKHSGGKQTFTKQHKMITRLLVLLFSFSLTFVSCQSDNGGIPVEVDCAIRNLALQYSQSILNGRGSDVISAALNISFCSSFTERSPKKISIQSNDDETPQAADLTYYVSLTGSDNNPGTISQPFRTLERARDQLRYRNPSQSATVYIRQGTYYLTRPFALYPQDSGSSDMALVTYANYPGEEVVISGGQPLTGIQWQPYRNGIYKAQLSSNWTHPITSLFLENKRLVRARYPNGDYNVPFSGYTNANQGYPFPNISGISVNVAQPLNPLGTWPTFLTLSGGPVTRYTKFMTPNVDSEVTYGFYYNETTFTNKVWENPQVAIIHMFHTEMWGNWQYQMSSIDYRNHSIFMSKGAWQEARGGQIDGNLYYVDNVFEELDYLGEWYYNHTTMELFYIPINTEQAKHLDSMTFVAPILKNIIDIRGFTDDRVKYIKIQGLTIRDSRPTFMDPYEVPSGGDWALHRGAAVFIEGAEHIYVDKCFFDQPGGNGLFLSNYAVHNRVTNCEFYGMGDSAVLAVGTSDMIVSTDTSPHHNFIGYNLMHEMGIYGKQTSGYFQSVAHHNTIKNNVMFNGPRAGICFNDGYGGGDIVEGNLIFNMVRETGDHGSFNSWDRLPYIWVKDQVATVSTDTYHIRHNFFINWNYLGETFGTRTLDHDDGSSYYYDYKNLLVYGGVKFRDGINRTASENIIIHSELEGAQFQVLQTNSVDYFVNNTLINYNPDGVFYSCAYLPDVRTPFIAKTNTFYTAENARTPFRAEECPGNVNTLVEWQFLGFDIGSKIFSAISVDHVISLAKSVLLF